MQSEIELINSWVNLSIVFHKYVCDADMGGTQSATPLLSSNSVSSSLTSVQVERRTKSQDEKRIRTMTRLITAKAIRDNGQEKEDHEYTQVKKKETTHCCIGVECC